MEGNRPITILYTNNHICNVQNTYSHPVVSMFKGDGTVMFQKHPGFDIDCDSTMLFSDVYAQAQPSYSPFEIRSLAKVKGYPLQYDFNSGFHSRAGTAKIIRHGLDTYEEIFVSPRFVEDCINAGVEIYWLESDWKSFFTKEWNKLLES